MASKELVKFVLVLASNPKNVGRVEGFLLKINQRMKLDETQFNKLLVAATEAVNNGIIHGNKRDPKKKVVLTCELSRAELKLRVEDEGAGVDPGSLPDPLAVENLMRENGRGVFLMKSLMDEVDFEKFSEGSAVTMKLALRTQGG
ncbi:MAG TPA: ATP-binding protein [Bacteroidota bacterium]|nr:ATP-binding protein [Bacteroidota bacterium]